MFDYWVHRKQVFLSREPKGVHAHICSCICLFFVCLWCCSEELVLFTKSQLIYFVKHECLHLKLAFLGAQNQ